MHRGNSHETGSLDDLAETVKSDFFSGAYSPAVRGAATTTRLRRSNAGRDLQAPAL